MKRHVLRDGLLLVAWLGGLLWGCASPMSVEEARKVAVSISERPEEAPPPRRITDILQALDAPGAFDAALTEQFKKRADASPPRSADPQILKAFYRDRGIAAFELSRMRQAKADLEQSLGYDSDEELGGRTKMVLGDVERSVGNLRQAKNLYQQAITYPGAPGYSPSAAYQRLMRLASLLGDEKGAGAALAGAKQICENPRLNSRRKASCNVQIATMEALRREIAGDFREAESWWRKAKELSIDRTEARLVEVPLSVISLELALARNLWFQRRLLEAETQVREALRMSLAHAGKASPMTVQILTLFSRIVRAQGRFDEADRLADEAARLLALTGISPDSQIAAHVGILKGDVLVNRRDYAGAAAQYERVRDSLRENQSFYVVMTANDPLIALSFVLAGRPGEAFRIADRNIKDFSRNYGEQHENTAEMVALRGMSRARMNAPAEALRDLHRATEILVASGPASTDGEGERNLFLRRRIYLDYVDLLHRLRTSPILTQQGIDPVATSFRLAEAARAGSVQGALLAAGARAAVTDEDLAALIRQEQDLGRQALALEAQMAEWMSLPVDLQNEQRLQAMRRQSDAIRTARTTLLAETRRRFPRYVEAMKPRQVSPSEVQRVLKPGELLLSFYVTDRQTFAWAVPAQGKMALFTAGPGRSALAALVTKLRSALDPKPLTLGDIPPFDVASAFSLYQALFSPVQPMIDQASNVYIVANDPLDQLPPAVLPQAAVPLSAPDAGRALFSEYREVPWLIRKVSLTLEPSVAGFLSIRALGPGDAKRQAFLGVGDPLFSPAQAAQEAKAEISPSAAIQVRSIRVTGQGGLDGDKLASVKSEQLSRLPDTAMELLAIAEVLGADPSRDVLLRRNAAEGRLKAMTLSDRKVLAFATHALVPGDLDGLEQPALALSSPLVTGEKDNGLLTMSEIMKLQLNADWVVLSACNTAAGGGSGASALSGLGQAFFYAGSRAILATQYPVETTAARKLVTGLFQRQAQDPTLSRAQALRQSMLNLLDRETLTDPVSGKTAASYAHPFFWAPYVIMGDPGP